MRLCRSLTAAAEYPANVRDLKGRKIGVTPLRICKHVSYTIAGTIEFILNEASGQFYFMELNTRIQVEYPVMEIVTGFELFKSPLRIAAEESLGLTQEQISINGHAIECRINTEDLENDFMPCPGLVTHFEVREGRDCA